MARSVAGFLLLVDVGPEFTLVGLDRVEEGALHAQAGSRDIRHGEDVRGDGRYAGDGLGYLDLALLLFLLIIDYLRLRVGYFEVHFVALGAEIVEERLSCF